jgi:Domain of unknown function (DUF4185)
MRFLAALGCVLLLCACTSTTPTASATPTVPATPTVSLASITDVAGSTQKVCQLTGETDRQLHQPTINQTETRVGLTGNDLGSSFEHDGKLFFLFGDSPPTPTFHGQPNGQSDPPRLADDNDSIAYTTDTSIDHCLHLTFLQDAIGAFKNPVVLNAQGQPAITLRTNEVPIAGISEGGKMYVIFGTDNPYANPTTPGAPKNLSSGPTRTVVAVSNDDAKTFHYLYDFSAGPNARFINTAIAPGADGYLYFWGTQGGLLYRHSVAYFARKPATSLGQAGGMEYFTGLGTDGQPHFSASEADAVPLFADHTGTSAAPANCMGELSVQWNSFVQRWVMLYNCTDQTSTNLSGIYMRVAQQPWGPWSAPQTIFNAGRDGGFCHFIHRAVTATNPACDDLSGPGRLSDGGGNYAPYIIAPFTTGDAARATSTFYYTMSTWNPYVVVIMQTTIQGSP